MVFSLVTTHGGRYHTRLRFKTRIRRLLRAISRSVPSGRTVCRWKLRVFQLLLFTPNYKGREIRDPSGANVPRKLQTFTRFVFKRSIAVIRQSGYPCAWLRYGSNSGGNSQKFAPPAEFPCGNARTRFQRKHASLQCALNTNYTLKYISSSRWVFSPRPTRMPGRLR